MKIFSVFVDGLKPENIKNMDFLSTLPVQKPIRTELGYSNTCHTSMYTGVYPNKHNIWFLWQNAPQTTPFNYLKHFPETFNDNIYLKYLNFLMTKFLNKQKYQSAFKLPFLWYMPLSKWKYFDVSEKKLWTTPGYNQFPTIFEYLAQNKKCYQIIGFSQKYLQLNNSLNIFKKAELNFKNDWIYAFVGDIDPLSHEYGQNSSMVIEKLHELDTQVEKFYRQCEKNNENFTFFLFSDHGHALVKNKINPNLFFRTFGKRLVDYIYFIDSNFLRFWVKDEKEREELFKILSSMGDLGFILSETHFKRYNLTMPDNRYGDIIFYLDYPNVFDFGNIKLFGKERTDTGKYISYHGYLPEYQDMNGVFVSNEPIHKSSIIQLQDIVPSMLPKLEIAEPNYLDGYDLWKT